MGAIAAQSDSPSDMAGSGASTQGVRQRHRRSADNIRRGGLGTAGADIRTAAPLRSASAPQAETDIRAGTPLGDAEAAAQTIPANGGIGAANPSPSQTSDVSPLSVDGRPGTGAESDATNGVALWQQRDEELRQREAEVLQRELTLHAQDALRQRGLPEALLHSLPLMSADALDAALPQVEAAFRAAVAQEVKQHLAGTAPVLGSGGGARDGALRRAFGLD